jgi:hypothetical protein
VRAALFFGAAVLAVTAACGRGAAVTSPGGPSSTTTAAPAPAPSQSPSPSPTTTVAAPATAVPPTGHGPAVAPSTAASTVPTTTRPRELLTDASRLRLDGVGPVRVGMTLAEATSAAHTTIRITGPDIGTDCRYAQAVDGPPGLAFMVVDGRIVRVDVWPSPPQPRPSPVATVSGAHVGSTEDQVKALYPGRIKVTQHPYLEKGHYLTYTPQDAAYRDFNLIFETDGERVTSFRSGYARNVGQVEGCA